jgi:hypothetical protein
VIVAHSARHVSGDDVLELIAPHGEPVVNEYDQIYGIRKDQVKVVWPITATGGTRSRVPTQSFVPAKFCGGAHHPLKNPPSYQSHRR